MWPHLVDLLQDRRVRVWLAWNELAIPETFWSESLEVLMKIEGDPSFRDGSSKVQWRQWLIIYKDVLKVPWDDVAFQFR